MRRQVKLIVAKTIIAFAAFVVGGFIIRTLRSLYLLNPKSFLWCSGLMIGMVAVMWAVSTVTDVDN